MSNARIVYTPRPDATPEGELSALATVYRFILDCHAKTSPNSDGSDNEDMLTISLFEGNRQRGGLRALPHLKDSRT